MRSSSIADLFPPFTRAVKMLVYVNCAIFLAMFIAASAGGSASALAGAAVGMFGLRPDSVVHGFVWQLFTYSFLHAGLHAGPMHLLFNMLSLWMFGSRLEQDWGMQRFLEFYFFCVIGAAVTTVGVSYTHILGMSPLASTIGASGGIYGLLVAFGVLYSKMRVYVMGIFPIEARWFAIIWVALALFGALSQGGGVNNVAHLGGALFGYIYLKALPRRGLKLAGSEGYYGVRNRYQRWKRRRMAKKFEVFMRQHDRKQYFDEYGNFRAPTEEERRRDEENGKGGGSSWVN